jgi:hypothetical protein
MNNGMTGMVGMGLQSMTMDGIPKYTDSEGDTSEKQKAAFAHARGVAQANEAGKDFYNGGDPYGYFKARGYADGGALDPAQPSPAPTPIGIGMDHMINQEQQSQQMQGHMQTMQDLFDAVILAITGKLNPEESQTVLQMVMQKLGPQQGQQFIESVKQAVAGKGGQGGQQDGRVVAGQPSDKDNVMAQDADTGEPIKLASGEAILPASMVHAAGGGIAGARNIVNAASRTMPNIRPHAQQFMRAAHG